MFKILRNTEKAVLKVSRVVTVNNLASHRKSSLAPCLHRAGEWTSFIKVKLRHAAQNQTVKKYSKIAVDGSRLIQGSDFKTLQNLGCFEG